MGRENLKKTNLKVNDYGLEVYTTNNYDQEIEKSKNIAKN